MPDTGAIADPASGYRRFLVYADDIGITGREPDGVTHKQQFRVHGSLWLPWERRGDLLRIVRELRETHAWSGSIETAMSRTEAEPFALALIDEVFRRRWLGYRAIVTVGARESEEDVAAPALLIARRLGSLPGGLAGRELRLRLCRRGRGIGGDAKLARSRIARSIDEAVLQPPSFARSIRAARTPEALAVVRMFDELICDDWEKKQGSLHRKRLSARIAENLGWADLAADTHPDEWKLNIAYVPDVRAAIVPAVPQRSVQLRLPLVD